MNYLKISSPGLQRLRQRQALPTPSTAYPDYPDVVQAAQQQGFRPQASLYGYDGNGNLTTDSGKDLTITWNPLNLPQFIEKPGETPVEFWYTFGGEKIRMLSGDGAKDYLGGAEFTGEPEAYYHADGRVMLKNKPIHQYHIKDHLGNLAVLFQDVDQDGLIDPNSDLEVPQRHFYYLPK